MPETPDHDPLPPNIRLFAPWTWEPADRWLAAFALAGLAFLGWLVIKAIEVTFAI